MISLDFKAVHTCTLKKRTLKSPALALGSTARHDEALGSLESGFKKAQSYEHSEISCATETQALEQGGILAKRKSTGEGGGKKPTTQGYN